MFRVLPFNLKLSVFLIGVISARAYVPITIPAIVECYGYDRGGRMDVIGAGTTDGVSRETA